MTDQNEKMSIEAALRRAFSMGQNYWSLADSESIAAQNRSDGVRQRFEVFIAEFVQSQQAQGEAVAVPVVNAYPSIHNDTKPKPIDQWLEGWLETCDGHHRTVYLAAIDFIRSVSGYRHPPAPLALDIDDLSNFIRMINGDNSMGAGALAECICEYLSGALKPDGGA